MSELEQKFHKAMIQVYENARRYCNYTPTVFFNMVKEHGGLATARKLVKGAEPSYGFLKLNKCNRLDISMEAVMLDPQYRSLFTQDELTLAADRLTAHGYTVR